MKHVYTIGDAVTCGEWLKYTDTETGNTVYERYKATWNGRFCRFKIWFLNLWDWTFASAA